ncbi:MAG: hypothetical protein ACJ72R_11080 [Nitrososphaeraceae archaeon]
MKNLKTPKLNGVPILKENYTMNTIDLAGEEKTFENQVWGALHKAWKGYVIAKNKYEYDKLVLYARITHECQYDLRLQVSSFDNIGTSAFSFLSLRVSECAQEDNNQEQVSEEVDQQYEQERFTDDNAYSEYFRDDYNKAKRFTF